MTENGGSLQRRLFARIGAIAMAAVSPLWSGGASAQTIAAGTDLAFGTFIAGATAGTVVVSTAGARSATGGVVLLTNAQFAQPAAGTMPVSGTGNRTYQITLPASATLSRTGGGSMSVGTFTSNPLPGLNGTKGYGQLANGAQTISIGATLSVGANQTAGSYSGTFDVTVVYQ